MDVTPLIRRDAQVIQSYRGGVFKVSGQLYQHAVFVLPDRVLPWKRAGQLTAAADFAPLQAHQDQVEIVLLGTGNRLVMPDPKLKHAVKDLYGFSLEPMDTGAACRTYNVLLAEGRKVAAALTLFD